MANIVTPADIPLPEFLDPLLSYLSDNLPQPVYSVLISFLSHGLALASALLTLIRSLLFESSNWNAQTLIPPLIALLSAYLAIVSLYRTTAWMLRTSFWFIKWGTILAGLAAGAGWFMGQNGNAWGGQGVANTMAGLVLDMINGERKNSARGSPSTGQRKRPKPWASFQAHRDWQYQEQQQQQDDKGDAQILMESVLSAAGSAIKENNWWGIFNGIGEEDVKVEKDKKPSGSGSISR